VNVKRKRVRKYPTEQKRKWHYRQRYGLEFGEYENLLEEQDRKCLTCGKEHGETKGTRLYVDHDHITGQVRGLLCSRCNTVAGALEDERFYNVYKYLKDRGALARLELILREKEPEHAGTT